MYILIEVGKRLWKYPEKGVPRQVEVGENMVRRQASRTGDGPSAGNSSPVSAEIEKETNRDSAFLIALIPP